ncbi:DUF1571 domain-containing protein [Planctomycetaceae bacterium SH139]
MTLKSLLKWLLLALLLVIAGVLLWKWRDRPPQPPPPPPAAVDVDTPGTRAVSLEEALDLARQALTAMEDSLVDYRGRMTKHEMVGGELLPKNEIEFRIRTRRANPTKPAENQPMAVYLHFLSPASVAGREVIWREDQLDGKLVVHEAGLLGKIKVPPLDPSGFLAMQGNRYPVSEIGFKNLVRELLRRGQQIEELGGAEVTLTDDYRVGDRKCLLLQVRPQFPPSSGDPLGIEFTLAEIAIDMERQIPLRYAAFGPPAEAGGPPQLQEEYVYLDVQLNTGLTANDFDPKNPNYNFP